MGVSNVGTGPVARTRPGWISEVTADAVVHFAWGIGDDNPLWHDPDSAATSGWGGAVAPPCLLYGVDETTVAPGHDTLRRVHRDVDWTWFDVLRPGDPLDARAELVSETTVGDDIEQRGRVVFTSGVRTVAVAETTCRRTAQAATAPADRPELRYSGEEIDRIERALLAESRHGPGGRDVEDVSVGDPIGAVHKGPLSIMDVVAWCAGTLGVVGEGADTAEGGLHDECATGPQLVSWIGQAATDWMGDDGFLQRLTVQTVSLPPLGSTTTVSGTVDAVADPSPGGTAVSLALTASSQSGETVATAACTVLLPSRVHGPVTLAPA